MWVAAETLGFTTFPPAYLSPQASGKNLLIGANFASAASGYYDKTALIYVCDQSGSPYYFIKQSGIEYFEMPNTVLLR